MITLHAQKRMMERKITIKQIEQALKKGRPKADYRGRDHIKKFVFGGVGVVADMHSKDILTVFHE
jgi:hypothetical protein